MSYCRFSDGDVYMYSSIYGGIECCACRLANKIPTIFTKGGSDDYYEFFGATQPCKHCGGKGCDACMMFDNKNFDTRTDAINHLLEHKKHGEKVPRYAINALKKELKELGDTRGLEGDKNASPLINIETGESIPLDKIGE